MYMYVCYVKHSACKNTKLIILPKVNYGTSTGGMWYPVCSHIITINTVTNGRLGPAVSGTL